MYVPKISWGSSVRTRKVTEQYYTLLEFTGQYHPCPLWLYNIMIVLGSLLPVFLMIILSYDRTRVSNTRYGNEYMILLSY